MAGRGIVVPRGPEHLMTASPFRLGPRSRVRRLLALSGALVAASAAFGSASALATTGPYSVTFKEPADLKDHVVYTPKYVPTDGKLPVLIWGEGGCIANGLIYKDFLSEIASHGILVIASGGLLQVGVTTSAMMDQSIAWAKAQDAKPGALLEGKIDAEHVAVAGHSCGGLEAYQVASRRSDIGAIAIMNSGQLQVSQTQLDKIKAPIMYLLGGTGDVAYKNGMRDYAHLNPLLPAFLATSNVGHFATYFNQNGGTFARFLKDWVLYRISNDPVAAKSFVGPNCLLCVNPKWKVLRRNIS
jgi:hypothetical protein